MVEVTLFIANAGEVYSSHRVIYIEINHLLRSSRFIWHMHSDSSHVQAETCARVETLHWNTWYKFNELFWDL